ncbi:Uncharacterised protein [BD1-7 clade bacterium]|uniref:Uncharacterized protein n=1 Tax=BD1-7 clade bacterium TaxID=2029982 RepID=A0A5S9R1G8_9GAMM|nr:Uncharacterised protein [BD1-7 clade bacterium]
MPYHPPKTDREPNPEDKETYTANSACRHMNQTNSERLDTPNFET